MRMHVVVARHDEFARRIDSRNSIAGDRDDHVSLGRTAGEVDDRYVRQNQVCRFGYLRMGDGRWRNTKNCEEEERRPLFHWLTEIEMLAKSWGPIRRCIIAGSTGHGTRLLVFAGRRECRESAGSFLFNEIFLPRYFVRENLYRAQLGSHRIIRSRSPEWSTTQQTASSSPQCVHCGRAAAWLES